MRFTRPRVIPCLLLQNKGLVKTRRFKDPVYLGDPINVVKLFNDKEVDELIFLDISATVENRAPNFRYLAEIATECFMPLGYGGGVRTVEHARQLTALGVEKIVINSYVAENPAFVRQAADLLGSSSVVVSMDVRRSWLGKYQVYTQGGRKNTGLDPEAFAVQVASMGAGEIMVNSIDRDGMMQGYDVALVRKVAQAVDVPVIACGGAGGVQDFSEAVFEGHASAVAAGSMFVFQGKHRAVLISYPGQQELDAVFAAPAG